MQVLKVWLELSARRFRSTCSFSRATFADPPETLSALCELHLKERAAMSILTAVPENPTGYGRVLRLTAGQPEVLAIVEQKALTPAQLATREINSGIYCFETAALFSKLDLLCTDNAHGELYLTDVAALLVGRRPARRGLAGESVDEVLGANTIAEVMHLDATMRAANARRLMAQGVTIYRPDTCVIDAEFSIGPDHGDRAVRPATGRDAHRLGVPHPLLLGHPALRPGQLRHSAQRMHSGRAEVGDGAVLGPYAHLRPESRIGEMAHVGNFCETKKVTLGRGSKANHLTYLGDAVIGSGVNVGAGVITCNYDGAKKAHHHHRRRGLRRLRLHAGCAGQHRGRGVRRRGLLHHHPVPPERWPSAAAARSPKRAGSPHAAPPGPRHAMQTSPAHSPPPKLAKKEVALRLPAM